MLMWPVLQRANLWSSGLDSSFKEMGFKGFEATKGGSAQECVPYEASQIVSAENTFTTAQRQSVKSSQAPASGFGAFASSGSSAFAAPSTTFAFGAPSRTSAFGASSAFGTPAFGAPPAATTSAFGAPQTMLWAIWFRSEGGSSAFGTSAHAPGSPSLIKPASGFGAYAGGGTGGFASGGTSTTTNPPAGGGRPFSAFANSQPSAFAAAAATKSAGGPVFGQSAFGQANVATAPASNAFGGSAFGASAQIQGGFLAFSNPHSEPTIANTDLSGQPSQGGASTAGAGVKYDFSQTKYNYRPGIVTSDTRLPANYIPGSGSVLPETVLAAFAALKFEWGKVPEWAPPVQLRVRHQGEVLSS
ncbi:hypothetical protein BKA70DRAFT_1404623 [Coprinopsis sp. MPI-PUGE-AT-0042]|nr:hypothetical protein BKA70DRAFT_1404623 [Coprinopsis sp. MPI-PUGE-AT-0042]